MSQHRLMPRSVKSAMRISAGGCIAALAASAVTVVDRWQQVAVGDVVNLAPEVARYSEDSALVVPRSWRP